jgi:hypothetical protein
MIMKKKMMVDREKIMSASSGAQRFSSTARLTDLQPVTGTGENVIYLLE